MDNVFARRLRAPQSKSFSTKAQLQFNACVIVHGLDGVDGGRGFLPFSRQCGFRGLGSARVDVCQQREPVNDSGLCNATQFSPMIAQQLASAFKL